MLATSLFHTYIENAKKQTLTHNNTVIKTAPCDVWQLGLPVTVVSLSLTLNSGTPSGSSGAVLPAIKQLVSPPAFQHLWSSDYQIGQLCVSLPLSFNLCLCFTFCFLFLNDCFSVEETSSVQCLGTC